MSDDAPDIVPEPIGPPQRPARVPLTARARAVQEQAQAAMKVAREQAQVWIHRAHVYERHISAASMVGGFIFDNWILGRIDVAETQLIYLGYITMACVSVALLHVMEVRDLGERYSRWRFFLVLATQFAFGSLWSALLIFYSRSAVIAASWPFMLMLFALFIGNEVLSKYFTRIVFSLILLFFILFACAVFLLPVYVHAIGPWVFGFSGVIAFVLFHFYMRIIRWIGGEAHRGDRQAAYMGAIAVYALVNVLYAGNLLPPLPLALTQSGVYHEIAKKGDFYTATGEAPDPWYIAWRTEPTVHVAKGQPVYVFSSVFAPIRLHTTISHRWLWYSPKKKAWLTRSVVQFAVNGGRDGGYRGYTIKRNPAEGEWRVDITTSDSRLIGRVSFTLAYGDLPPPLVTRVIH
jgi:hypothetical protein